MKGKKLSSPPAAQLPDQSAVIATSAQIDLLLNREYLTVIKLLSCQPASVGELSQALGLEIKLLHYRVRRLLEHGLLHIVSEEKRGGRPIKRYGLRSLRYRLPFVNTSSATLEDLLLGQLNEQQRLFSQHLAYHLMQSEHPESDAFFSVDIREGTIDLQIQIDERVSGHSSLVRWLPVLMDMMHGTTDDTLAALKRYKENANVRHRNTSGFRIYSVHV